MSDPTFRDAANRRDTCRYQQEIVSLQDELRLHAGVQDWPAVLSVNEQLAALDATQADLDGWATVAREQLHRQQEAERAAAENGEKASGLREQLPALAEAQQKAASEQHARVQQQAGQDAAQRADHPHSKALARLRTSRRGKIIVLGGLTAMVALTLVVLTLTLGTRTTDGPTTNRPGATTTHVPTMGQQVRTLTGHTGYVHAVAVTPDGRQVVSGSNDKTVRVWDLASA